MSRRKLSGYRGDRRLRNCNTGTISRNRGSVIALLLCAAGVLAGVPAPAAALDVEKSAERPGPADIRLSPTGDAVWFDGFIDDEAVSVVEPVLQAGRIKTLYIRSTGGHVGAGMRLGTLVRDAGVTVNVRSYCLSSCANYVFTAARARIINGVVLWHGGVEQKDIREVHLCGRLVSSLYGRQMGEIAADRRDAALEAWQAMRERERAFFESIGVNAYITRAGQEPVPHVADYTYDVPSMERLGLGNITAPEGYGTPAWCERINQGAAFRRVECLVVTEEMLRYERDRIQRGEECQPDGTLKVRPAEP